MNKQSRILAFWGNLFMSVLTVVTLIPFLLLIMSSLTDEAALVRDGYSFFPKQFSVMSYKYLFDQADYIFNAIRISVTVTVLGTTISMLITCMLVYTLSRRDFPLRKPLSFFVFFTMLFNGGLVPTYLIYTQNFHIKNTLAGLIVPGLLLTGFNVILVRTFFATNSGAFDRLYGGHGAPVSADIVDEAIDLCHEILAGKDDAAPHTDAGGRTYQYGKRKNAAYQRDDGKTANIAYTPEHIRTPERSREVTPLPERFC